MVMKTKILSAALALMVAAPASAATIVAWESENTATGDRLAASEEGAFVTQFSLGRSDGLLAGSGNSFNSRDWEEGTDKLSALANDNAIFWGFDATEGYDLTSLSIGYDRSATGPVSIAIDFFINNVFQGEIFADTNVAANSTASATIDLTAFDNVQNGFFRLTGWGGTNPAGTFDIENRAAFGGNGIVLTGELAAVPLPAGMVLLLTGLGALGVARRRA